MGKKGRKFLTYPDQRAIFISLSAEAMYGCFAGRSQFRRTRSRKSPRPPLYQKGVFRLSIEGG